MENATKIIGASLLIVILSITGCQQKKVKKSQPVIEVQNMALKKPLKSEKRQDSLKCFNDPKNFKVTKNHLLFNDSLGRLYLRRKNSLPKNPSIPYSECQKLPYGFVNTMALLNDSIVTIDDIIDLDSFKKLKNTCTFYKDKNRAYVYQEVPVSYPAFSEIGLNPQKVIVIDSLYAKDNISVYYQGIRLDIADPNTFASRTYRDTLGENLTLVYDKTNIYHYGGLYDEERLNYVPLYKKQQDSIRAIYFQ